MERIAMSQEERDWLGWLYRRIFSRFEKPDVVFMAFLSFALIVEALRLV